MFFPEIQAAYSRNTINPEIDHVYPSEATSSKMSTTSSLGLSAHGEAAPPLGAKTEEIVRGIAFKVSCV